MSTPWYSSSAYPWAQGGFSGPDPITMGSSGWTWDVEFKPVSGSLYARSCLGTFTNIGGDTGWILSGIVEYRTRNANGSDTVHHIGQANVDGVVAFAWDHNVDSVTFGWTIEGDDFVQSRVVMEIWT